LQEEGAAEEVAGVEMGEGTGGGAKTGRVCWASRRRAAELAVVRVKRGEAWYEERAAVWKAVEDAEGEGGVEMVGEDEASMSPSIGGEGVAGGVVVLVVVVVGVGVEARAREASITCSRLPTASCRRRRMAARCSQSPRRQNRMRPWRTLGRPRNVTGRSACSHVLTSAQPLGTAR
jgi:hypothetical protein